MNREEIQNWQSRPRPNGTWRDFLPPLVGDGELDNRTPEEWELFRVRVPVGIA